MRIQAKSFLLFLLGALFLPQIHSQTVEDFNKLRLKTNQQTMYVLGGWAVTNISTGLILRSQTEGTARYFHEMNVFWNVVNLGLAAGPIIGSFREQTPESDLWKSLKAQGKIEKILLFNAGLDIGYMASGAYLIERSKNATDNADQLKGYGQSLLLQGGFLFLFDLTAFLIHQRQGNIHLRPLVNTNSAQINMSLRF